MTGCSATACLNPHTRVCKLAADERRAGTQAKATPFLIRNLNSAIGSMSITRKIKRALRGEVGLLAALLEAGRRRGVPAPRRRGRLAPGGRPGGGAAPPSRLSHALVPTSRAEHVQRL